MKIYKQRFSLWQER